MLRIWISYAALFLWLEIIYHVSGFGFHLGNVPFTLFTVCAWASVESLILLVVKGKAKKVVYQIGIWWSIAWTVAQITYLHIFKQPMLWEAVFTGGQDALTNYWREALTGFVQVSPYVALCVLPGVVICVLRHKKKIKLPNLNSMRFMRCLVAIVVCVFACIIDMAVGKAAEANYYENYKEFFDPLMVAEEMGVHPMLQRDTVMSIAGVFENISYKAKKKSGNQPTQQAYNGQGNSGANTGVTNPSGQGSFNQGSNSLNDPKNPGDPSNPGQEVTPDSTPDPEVFVPQPNAFNIDADKLMSLADNKKQSWLADYILNEQPTMTNEMTGIFEGYNVIFLTAEGFSPYAVREDITPTLYHLIHTGFVFNNYYVPLWATSTSDGEYVNNTGLIPDGQFSMRKSADDYMPYTLAGFYNRTGIQSRAYHNNSLSYYDRHRTHPNLGYLFKACKLGDVSEKEYGQYIFQMEEANRWPSSDYQMMIATMPEYVNDERFFVYYMTVSGHMNYLFKGNSMSAKNRDAVKDLPLSENGQAYIACHVELDKALEYMLEQLKEAGQLEKTLIVLSADHYPYAMSTEEYEELAGKSLSYGMDVYRNNLIMWNVQFEDEIKVVNKPCCSVDLLPTILNLLGMPYDSRMYAGKDIFCDEEGMVIFKDRSFVTDGLIYNRKTKEAIWLKDESGNYIVPQNQQDDYLKQKQQEVKDQYQFSAYILEENYYADIEAARIYE
ncbi:MAG: LTA synthase family protein [Lachnospiraceae bacterium]|nr:LTA synthase family protein [Lachnospiraceae bacterium]